MKATWPTGSALRGDLWMKSRLNETLWSRLANLERSLRDIEINDGMEQALAKRVQRHRIMDDLTLRLDRTTIFESAHWRHMA